MIMWAPSQHGRGFLLEADHMLLHPVQVAVKCCRDLSDGPIKYFSDGEFKSISSNPESSFWVNSVAIT